MPRPLGRPAALGVEVFSDSSWRARLVEDVNSASTVLMASFVYDEPELQQAFERRLAGRAEFSLELLVDAGQFNERNSVHQRPRLLELQRLAHCAQALFEIGRRLAE